MHADKPECKTGPRVKAIFDPNARHLEVVSLLRKLEMNVQAGPSETGEFWLSVPLGHSTQEAVAMLRSSALIEEAMETRELRSFTACGK